MRINLRVLAFFAAVTATAAACGGNGNPEVQCGATSDCDLSAGGVCETNAATGSKWCSYPDMTCPAGLRWSTFGTGDGVAGACVPVQPTLTVQIGGNGGGTITSDPAGIDCPGTCSASFTQGTKVMLSASPSSSVFLGWSGACSGSLTCAVTLDADSQVSALFGVPGSNLWVQQTNSTTAGAIDSVKVASNGDVVVAGAFSGTITLGGKSLTSPSNAFAARLRASDGSAVWLVKLGGAGDVKAFSVDVDKNDDVVVSGPFTGSVSFGGETFNASASGSVYVVKLDGATGAHVWSNWMGGVAESPENGVAFDPDGNVVMTGDFSASIKPGTQTYNTKGGKDFFLTKFAAADGAELWTKTYGGAQDDQGLAIAVDGSGNVAVAGGFTGTVDFGAGTLMPPSGVTTGNFLAKYASANGAPLVAKYIDAGPGALAMDSAGDVYMTGTYQGTADLGGSAPLMSVAGSDDAFLVKYSTAGSLQWAESFGNDQQDQGLAVRLDEAGNVVVCGTFFGTVSYGGASLSSAGGQDIFLAQFRASDGSHLASMRFGGTSYDDPGGIASTPSGDVVIVGGFSNLSDLGGVALTASSTSGFDGFALLLMPLS